MLFGVSEVELNLEAQAVIVDKSLIRQCQVTAEQEHMCPPLGSEMGLLDNDDIESLSKLLVQHHCLIDARLDAVVDTHLL